MTLYVKQYGDFRTGTSFTRAFLESYLDCKVLVNVLGWKHGLPEDPVLWMHNHVRTAYKPLKIEVCGRRLNEFDVEGLLEAVRTNTVRRCLSIRNPFAWIRSWIKQVHRKAARDTSTDRVFLDESCRRFNESHRAWLDDDWYKGKTIIVRHEDLLTADPEVIAGEFSELLNIPTKFHDIDQRLRKVVDASHEHSFNFGRRFDRAYYMQDKYMNELGREAKDILLDRLDWDFLETNFGYTPESRYATWTPTTLPLLV